MLRDNLLSEGKSIADGIPAELYGDAQSTSRKAYRLARYAALVVRPGLAERENSKVDPNGQCGRGALARTWTQHQRGEFIAPGFEKVCVC